MSVLTRKSNESVVIGGSRSNEADIPEAHDEWPVSSILIAGDRHHEHE